MSNALAGTAAEAKRSSLLLPVDIARHSKLHTLRCAAQPMDILSIRADLCGKA